jgi:hypothetical protein
MENRNWKHYFRWSLGLHLVVLTALGLVLQFISDDAAGPFHGAHPGESGRLRTGRRTGSREKRRQRGNGRYGEPWHSSRYRRDVR